MRKLLFIAFITVLGFKSVSAQGVQFGIQGGLNFSSLRNVDEPDQITAFNAGIVLDIPASERFSFQPGLTYSGQGYSIEDNTVDLSYLNVPLMLQYRIFHGLSLNAGPQVGFLLDAKDDDIDLKDSFESVDFGLNLGISYRFNNGFNLGAQYNMGLSDITDIEELDLSENGQNGVYQLSVGYFF